MTYSIESFLCDLDYSIAYESLDYAIESGFLDKVNDIIERVVNVILYYVMQFIAKIRGIKEIYINKEYGDFKNRKDVLELLEEDIKRVDSGEQPQIANIRKNYEAHKKVSIAEVKKGLITASKKVKDLKNEIKSKAKNTEDYIMIKNKIKWFNEIINNYYRVIITGIRVYSKHNSDEGKKNKWYAWWKR